MSRVPGSQRRGPQWRGQPQRHPGHGLLLQTGVTSVKGVSGQVCRSQGNPGKEKFYFLLPLSLWNPGHQGPMLKVAHGMVTATRGCCQ